MESNLAKYIKTPEVFIQFDLVIKVVYFKGKKRSAGKDTRTNMFITMPFIMGLKVGLI